MHRLTAWNLLVCVAISVPAYAQNTTTRESVGSGGAQSNGGSFSTGLSADGRYIMFGSLASNLVTGDTNATADVFVHDRQLGTTERVSVGTGGVQGNGQSNAPAMSSNGAVVVFATFATNLVANDTNGFTDVIAFNRNTNSATRVSVATGGTQATGGNSGNPAVNASGRYVVFSSNATNLVANDTNNTTDIFRHDRGTNTTIRVSLTNGGVQATAGSFQGKVNGDGQVVTFYSAAVNLVPGDTNARLDVFVRDITAGTTTRVSVGPGGVQANGDSRDPWVSADGRFVTFESEATNLVANGGPGVYVHDRMTGLTSALSISTSGTQTSVDPKISADGRYICFTYNLFNAPSEVFVIDRLTLAKTRISVSTDGQKADGDSTDCSINDDGTMVAFSSTGANLVAADSNGFGDVFLRTALATVALDKTTLAFGAVYNGASFVSQTAPQTVRVMQSGSGTVTWTVASSQTWLQVSPASGTGTGNLTVSVVPTAGLPITGTVTASIFVSLTGSANALPPIPVTLTLTPFGTSTIPFGTVDTPTDNRTGVTGAVPFTGWALDDVGVTRVSICRAAFGAEVAPVDPNCGGAAEIFIGFAVFIDGARPDVAAGFTSYPQSTRAGWGFMVLTNMLPAQGNGTYRFTMRAQDQEGNWFVLGRRTMTCANASATMPFGTLDTPLQGGTAAGTSYINFGWALTPQPKTIPINGSTIRVVVDGVDIGPADYNHLRSDVQALFPGLNNTDGAIGFRIIDTTLMDNGLHTISWAVTDNAGATEGLGSRFFTVANGASSVTAASSSAPAPDDISAAALDMTPLAGRRGWNLDAPFRWFTAGASGVIVVRSEEVNRVELQLGTGAYTGYQRTAAGFTPLPIGSHLDSATNTFTWAPGVGFVGPYDLVFVRSVDGRAVSRREVRIVLHPKGRGAVGPQIVIDTPRVDAVVQQPFMIGGWAVDLDAPEGTGVTTLHAWAFPTSGGAPMFLGATAHGGARPDVAAIHGDRFKDSGFGLIVQGLPAGDYDLAVFAWSTETGGFVAPQFVRVRVIP